MPPHHHGSTTNGLTGSSVPFRTPSITFSQHATLPLGISTPVCRLVAHRDLASRIHVRNAVKRTLHAQVEFFRLRTLALPQLPKCVGARTSSAMSNSARVILRAD